MRSHAWLFVVAVVLISVPLSSQTTTQVTTHTTFTQHTVQTLEERMREWPTSFDGITALGPYKWLDISQYRQTDPSLTYAVLGVTTGPQHICRAYYKDHVHPGKLHQGTCYIGWGGAEIA